MRAMLPKDVLERFLDGPFQYEELRIVCLHMWEKLAGQDANSGSQPMDIGQIDKSEGEDEDVNAVQQRRPHDLSNHKQESDNERKPFNRRTANSSPSASHQSTPRDKKPVVETVILSSSAHQGMIVRTWMKSEQSRPVMLTVICLVWIGAMTPLRQLSDRTERQNSWCERIAGIR